MTCRIEIEISVNQCGLVVSLVRNKPFVPRSRVELGFVAPTQPIASVICTLLSPTRARYQPAFNRFDTWDMERHDHGSHRARHTASNLLRTAAGHHWTLSISPEPNGIGRHLARHRGRYFHRKYLGHPLRDCRRSSLALHRSRFRRTGVTDPIRRALSNLLQPRRPVASPFA